MRCSHSTHEPASSAAREPVVDGAAQVVVAAKPARERHVLQADAVLLAEVAQASQPVQLGEAVDAVAGPGAPRDDEPLILEIAKHPGRPAGLGGGGADGERCLHLAQPYHSRVKVSQGADVPWRP